MHLLAGEHNTTLHHRPPFKKKSKIQEEIQKYSGRNPKPTARIVGEAICVVRTQQEENICNTMLHLYINSAAPPGGRVSGVVGERKNVSDQWAIDIPTARQ